ncbi:mechanosensitive ion channel domain-containing protein [Microbulbifer thermotolerans]|uniref:Mechanosensitive ion channel protein MscS n=1 Tax=Microbulbifer thermotolerans TaxID=252514 RepID=A0A143HID2_MICTH|nr:mechanosensitive ion channel domain-containing protein [Microbulbifer thermotolerans]AMX01475.1 mechanosensitive ion channel protein MscS [Microbulbifer thermotolerans]
MTGEYRVVSFLITRAVEVGIRILVFFILCLLLGGISPFANAQLPGQKKEQFEPVIPNFSAPSADWWSGWPDASREERREWLQDLTLAWEEWRNQLPEEEGLQKQAAAIDKALKGVEITWRKHAEYQRIPLLQDVKFPPDPNILTWAESDAAVNRGRLRLFGLQLEARQLDDTLSQSLVQLRKQIVRMREAKGQAKKESAALALLLAQINQLNIIEQSESLQDQLKAWQEQLDLAEGQLNRMLAELQFSSEAGEALVKDIEKQTAEIDQLAAERTALQSATVESTEPEANLKKDLALMQLEVDLLEGYLEKRKDELLLSTNSVLGEVEEKLPLVVSRDLVDSARTLIDGISRQLNIRQRQVVAWRSEEGQELDRWWRAFERIDSGLARARDLIDDVQRYELAQLQVYKERQGWWATVRERTGYFSDLFYRRWRELADYQLFTIAQNPITLRQIAKIIFVLVSAWLISGLTRRFLNRLVRKKRASEQSMYNLGRVLHYSIIAVGLVVALAMLGLDTSKLALVAGALSVGIGFGLQAIFSNFISGLILLFEQPLRVGDLVELESGVFGRIRDINVRSTRITTRDNVDILVPNSEFVAGRVINHTLEDPVRRIHVPFGVAYGSDPDLVREAAMEAARRVNITHTDWKRKTEVWLMEFGESALRFKLVVWVNSNMVSSLGDLYALYNLELLREFREKGIEFPFPQRDLHLRSCEAPLPITRKNGN